MANQRASDAAYGWDEDSKYFNFNGYRVAMALGKFPATPKNDFWIRLYFTAGKETGSGTSRIIFHKNLKTLAAK